MHVCPVLDLILFVVAPNNDNKHKAGSSYSLSCSPHPSTDMLIWEASSGEAALPEKLN